MSRRTRRHLARTITAAAGAAGTVLLLAGPSSAHVRVIGDVLPGKPATLGFRVPSELAEATTVRVAVLVPKNLKIVSVPAVKGWTERTMPGTGGATRLVWTAKPGGQIEPNDSRIFNVNFGPFPDQYALTFNTEQTYSDGTVANWNQKQTGSKEPEFPSPVLVIDPQAGPPPAATGQAGAASKAKPSVAAQPGQSTASSDDGGGISGGLLAVIGGAVAVVAGLGTALLRRRRNEGAARP